MKKIEYFEGFRAAMAGCPETENPYHFQTESFAQWEWGWWDAQ
jgi:hypothetical protein